jgi:hypothetical protein
VRLRSHLALLALGALGCLATHEAGAQTTATGTATMTMGTVLYISVTNTSPSFTPAASDLNTGSMVASTTSFVTTKANVAHDVTLTAGAASFTFTPGTGVSGSRTKPASDLQVAVKPSGGSFGSYSSVSNTTPVAIATARAAGDQSSAQPEVKYQMLLSYQDLPGTYTLGITYTVSAN